MFIIKKKKILWPRKPLKCFIYKQIQEKEAKGEDFHQTFSGVGPPPPKTEHGNEAPLYHAFPHLVRLQMSREERPGHPGMKNTLVFLKAK